MGIGLQPGMLSLSAEKALFTEYREGLAEGPPGGAVGCYQGTAKAAEARIVEAFQPLVKGIAGKAYKGNQGYALLDDLISAGNQGLLTAVAEYDPEKGVRFSAYARWWILDSVHEQIRSDRYPMHIPRYISKILLSMSRVETSLHRELGSKPNIIQIAKRMDLPVSRVRKLRAWNTTNNLSLDTPVGQDGQSTLGDFIPDRRNMHDGGPTNLDAALPPARAAIFQVLKTLTPREEKIIKMRFGFETDAESTLEEIAPQFAVTRQRIMQIEHKALRKLRHPMRSKILRPHVEALLSARADSKS